MITEIWKMSPIFVLFYTLHCNFSNINADFISIFHRNHDASLFISNKGEVVLIFRKCPMQVIYCFIIINQFTQTHSFTQVKLTLDLWTFINFLDLFLCMWLLFLQLSHFIDCPAKTLLLYLVQCWTFWVSTKSENGIQSHVHSQAHTHTTHYNTTPSWTSAFQQLCDGVWTYSNNQMFSASLMGRSAYRALLLMY